MLLTSATLMVLLVEDEVVEDRVVGAWSTDSFLCVWTTSSTVFVLFDEILDLLSES